MNHALFVRFNIPLSWFGEDEGEELGVIEKETDSGGNAEGSGDSTVGGDAGGKTGTKLPALYEQLSKAEKATLLEQATKDKSFVDKLPKTLSDLWKAHAANEAKLKTAVQRPEKGAPKERWDAYWKQMGRPDAPDGYVLKKPDLPKGLRYNEGVEKWFRQAFHENGIPQEAAEKIFSGFMATQASNYQASLAAKAKQEESRVAALKKAAKDADDQIRSEYGQKYPDFVANAKKAMQSHMDESLFQLLVEKGLDNDPRMLKAWGKIGEEMSDDKFVHGDGLGGKKGPRTGLAKTPGGFTFEYPEMRKNPNYAPSDD